MNKLLITALALLGTCTTTVAEDNKGVEPTAGGTYNLYNVGAKQFLGTENGRLVLGGEKVKVTLELIESTTTPGFYRISSDNSMWGAELWGTPSAYGGTFNEWRIEPVEGAYAISSRNTEASASMYLYQNTIYNRLSATTQMPGKEFETAQWLFVDPSTPETAIESIETNDVQTEQTTNTTTGVHNIGGQQLRSTDNTEGLQDGIYIVGGKKTLLKK